MVLPQYIYVKEKGKTNVNVHKSPPHQKNILLQTSPAPPSPIIITNHSSIPSVPLRPYTHPRLHLRLHRLNDRPHLVINRILRIRQVKNDTRMRPRTTPAACKDLLKVNRSVEVERAILVNIDPVSLVVTRCIQHRDIARLHKVARDQNVLPVGRDLEVVRADDGLGGIRVVETLDVLEVGDIEGGHVVAEGNAEVREAAILGDVRVDGEGLLSLIAEVVEQLSHTLFSVGSSAEGVDNPDLAGADCGGKGGRFGVARDELNVLDAGAVGDVDRGDDGLGVDVPESESAGLLDAEGGLEDRVGDDEIRSESNALLKVDAQAVGRKLLAKDVESAVDILGPFMDDVASLVSLNETARRGARSTAHVSDEETTIGLSHNLVDNGAKNAAVGVVELGTIGVGHVKVEGRILGLEEREEATPDKKLAISGCAEMVGRVAAGRHIGDINNVTKGIVVETGRDQEIFVLVVAGAGPEVANLLGLNVGSRERFALKWRGRDLQNRERRGVVRQRLRDPGDEGDQRR